VARQPGAAVDDALEAAEPGLLSELDAVAAGYRRWALENPELVTVPAPLLAVMLRGWARIHGLVSLEVFGHLRWTDADVGELLATGTRSIVDELT
jgi:hypothetical protein